MEKAIKRRYSNINGFSYFELMAGTAVLLLAMLFFVFVYRSVNITKIEAKELTLMATVAQNMAEVYKSTGDFESAKNEGSVEGFPNANIQMDSAQPDLVVITVPPRKKAYRGTAYILKFAAISNNNIKR